MSTLEVQQVTFLLGKLGKNCYSRFTFDHQENLFSDVSVKETLRKYTRIGEMLKLIKKNFTVLIYLITININQAPL